MLQYWVAINILLWSVGVKIGDNFLSLNVIILIPVGIFWLFRKGKITRVSAKVAVTSLCVALLSLVVAIIGPCEDKFLKSILSAPLLILLLFIGTEIGRQANNQDWRKLQRTIYWIIAISLVFVIAEMLFPSFFSPDKFKYHLKYQYSGLFYEPSHVAVSLFPCIAILLSSNAKSNNRAGLFALLLLFIFSRSSTLFILTICYITYRTALLKNITQSIKYIFVVSLVIIIGLAISYDLLIEPTVERVEAFTSPEKTNYSSMIYQKGWQDALDNFSRTYGIGLGFNMMGCSPLPDVPIRRYLSAPGRMDLNNEDGAFLFSKIMSEFGAIGIIFFLWAIARWLHYEYQTRNLAEFSSNEISTIHSSFMFSFIASSLLRSSGYFNGGFLLWATAVAGSFVLIRNQTIKEPHRSIKSINTL